MSMQVRPGYKLTEVGVIPEDWELSELSALSVTSSGTTPARSLADRYYKDGTVHWVKTLDLNNSEIADTDELVTQAALEETCLRVYPEGTVLVAMYGGFNQIGRTGLLRTPAAVNQAITAVQTKSVLQSEYLLATLNYRIDYWKSVASSSRKDPNITSQDVRSFKISFPKIKEQRAIAAALFDADALISVLDQLIAKKRDIKQAAMQQLLSGQQRLPGFSGEWKIKRLGDVCKITTGKKDVNEGNPAGQYPFFTCARNHTYSNHYSFECEAILVAGNGDVGNLNYFSGRFEAYQRTYVLYDFTEITNYVWQQLSAHLTDSLGIGKIGSSIPYIKKGNLTNFEFRCPVEIEEQALIATILSDMDSELSTLEARSDKARQLKQGMMQELLTGRIRLSQSSQEAKLC